jgi:mono/diheme cytochrome c family protein
MKNILKTIVSSSLGISALALISACGPSGNSPNVELLQDMMVQPAVKAQRYDEYFKNGISELVPPEHTAPVGFKPYIYGFDADRAEKEIKNPIKGDMSEVVLAVGQKYFETQCMVCHGPRGAGDGPVAPKFPAIKPPPMLSAKIRGWTDERIYHTITVGQGLMGPYASHVPQAYRWQVVNYIRFLQKNNP